MKLILLTLLYILPLIGFTQSQNYWVKKNNFPGLKRARTISFSIQNKGYVGMGVDTADHVLNDLWEFDAATNSWTQKANLPGSVRRNAIAFAIEKIGYVGTGMDSAIATNGQTLSDFWAYNPATNQWVQKTDFPGSNANGIYFATAFTTDNKGYICGGKKGPNDYSDELWEYKPSNDAWIQKSNFPGGVRYQLTSFVVDGLAFVGLGVDQNVFRKDIWQYNPANGLWIQKNDFSGGVRAGVCSFSLQQRGFIALGGDGGFKKDLWEYNPFSDSWSIRSEFGGSARKNAFVFTIGDYAYMGTGKGSSGKKESIYQYIPFDALDLVKKDFVSIKIFPTFSNNGLIHILSPENGTISVVNIKGQIIHFQSINRNENRLIDLSKYEHGIYLLHFTNEDFSISKTEKIIIH